MINPVVVEDSLRVFFPTSDDAGSSTVAGHSTVNYFDAAPPVEVVYLSPSCVRVVDDVADKNSMFRNSSICNDVTFFGDYIGLRDLGFTKPAVATIGGCIRSVYATVVNVRGVSQLVNDGLDSAETQAELHLYKMRMFEALESRRRALDYMYDFLEDAFENRDTRMIDHMLLLASRDLVGHSLSVSFLRATSRARKHLSFWRLFSSKVRNSLMDHPDANKLLKGLD